MARTATPKRTESEERIATHAIAIRRQMKEIEDLLQTIESGKQDWASVSDLFEVRRLLSQTVSQISPF